MADKKIEEHRVGKVANSTIKHRGLLGRIGRSLLEEDLRSMEDHVIEDIAVPKLKDFALEMVETMLYGRPKGRNKKNTYDRASYATYYYNGYENGPRRDVEDRRPSFDTSDIVIDSYGEASEVLQNLIELIAKYGVARVGDFYDLVGVSSRKGGYTSNNYGWFDIEGTRIMRARGGGYILDLPKPVPLE